MKVSTLVAASLIALMTCAVPADAQQDADPMRLDPQVAEQFERHVTLMERYLTVVREFDALAADPSSSGVAAVITAKGIVEKRGTNAAIKFFMEMLPEVQNPSVQRAIRLQLVELHRSAGQDEEALTHLRHLMTTAPADERR